MLIILFDDYTYVAVCTAPFGSQCLADALRRARIAAGAEPSLDPGVGAGLVAGEAGVEPHHADVHLGGQKERPHVGAQNRPGSIQMGTSGNIRTAMHVRSKRPPRPLHTVGVQAGPI